MEIRKSLLVATVAAGLLAGCSDSQVPEVEAAKAGAAGEVVVYSSRQEYLIRPVFERFTAETGIKVSYTTDNEGALISRLEAEGANSPADLFITVDAGNLWLAAEKGLLQPVNSEVLEASIPANLQDPDNRWFAQTIRARTIVYSTERVQPEQLSTYEALADEQWKGRVCLRTSKKVYNQSLVATLIERLGEEQAEQVVKGWIDNLATEVFANDNAVMEAIAAGQCDVGIVNSYYYGRLTRDKDLPIKLFWPNQETSGVHINVSGVGLTVHAPNRDNAIQLMEWMSQGTAQSLLANENFEYPANPAVPAAEAVQAWGDYKRDDLNVSIAGKRQVEAVKLMDRVNYR